VDPANPQPVPHPEQTVPLINFIFYMFLDKLIWKAWKTPALPYDELPPMTDYDRSAYLAKIHLHKLDPLYRRKKGLRQRHIIWGILATFWREASIMVAMIVIKSASEFAGPLGINRLLNHMQMGESSSEVRPWVWILILFLGPAIGTIAFQFYIFTSTRAITRAEALFTQLIFDHALRIKMRDEVDPELIEAGPVSGAMTPAIVIEDTSDAVNGHTTVEEVNSDNGTTLNGLAQANGKGDNASTYSKGKGKGDVAGDKKKESKDIVGKINNLMGSDIDAIVEGRDVLLVLLFSPLQITFAVIFLWNVLGWSSLVGMACIVVTLPIPGYLSKFMHSVQIDLMKASDARLAKVTEAINALKMLKLFAWEEKMNEQLALKREIELKLSRKKQFINQGE
jgi:ABC-type multidrug transport system fused ATPase/permease subunit